jgi:hypothetical protein
VFADLNDPHPPAPDRDGLDRYVHVRRRRRTVIGAVSSAVVVMGVVVTALLVSNREAPRAVVVLNPSPTSSPPAPSPSASPCAGFPGSCPDGRPGWSGGFAGCEVATKVEPAPSERELMPGLTAALTLPATAAAGESVPVRLTVSNTTAHAVRIFLSDGFNTGPVAVGAAGGSGVHFTDVGGAVELVVPARSSADQTYTLTTTTCGDTGEDAEPALPAGDYNVGLTLHYGIPAASRTDRELVLASTIGLT